MYIYIYIYICPHSGCGTPDECCTDVRPCLANNINSNSNSNSNSISNSNSNSE